MTNCCEAVQHIIVDRFKGDAKPELTLVPRESHQELWLPLHCFDLSPEGKNGCSLTWHHNNLFILFSTCHCAVLTCYVCQVCLSCLSCLFVFSSHIRVYPQNAQFGAHFREFQSGYRSSAESVQVKFPRVDGSRAILPFSIGFVDGQLKVLTMVALTMFMHELAACLNKAVLFFGSVVLHCYSYTSYTIHWINFII